MDPGFCRDDGLGWLLGLTAGFAACGTSSPRRAAPMR
jgi:hypothetical protein